MKRRGVHVDIRAPRQRARFIEQGGAVLRRAGRAAGEQLEREGTTANFHSMLTHAISLTTASPTWA
eukprot:6092903-Pyramimonas_sp.AAC.1